MRASRLVVAEDAPSTRPAIARVPGSKLRPRPGLSRATHDPNVAKSNKSASGTSSKDPVKKEVIAPAESATAAIASTTAGAGSQPVKRKRDTTGDVPAKTVKSRLPVAGDKENRHKHRTIAYVEITAPPARTRPAASSSAAVEPGIAERRIAGGSAAARSRTRVVKEEVKENVKEEVFENAPIPVDDEMVIDEEAAPVRSSRRAVSRNLPEKHVSKRRRTSSPGQDGPLHKEKVAPVLNDLGNQAPLPSLALTAQDHALAQATAQADEIKWDDLDKEDEADPLMVSEYVVEIFQYLQRLERTTMPNPNYIDNQKDLAWKMRGILMDWLIQVHSRFRLLPETLFLAVNIIDRFLSARTVSLVRLQLVGITAMFIAAKYEEIMAPSVNNFIYCSDSTYQEKDILDAEKYILRSLDWNLSYPNPINFLRRSSKADGYDLQVRTIAKYLVEIACVDWKLLPHPPSCIAAAGMWLARLVLEKEEWVRFNLFSRDAVILVLTVIFPSLI